MTRPVGTRQSHHRPGKRNECTRGDERYRNACGRCYDGKREPATDLPNGLGLVEERVHSRLYIARSAPVHPDHTDRPGHIEHEERT